MSDENRPDQTPAGQLRDPHSRGQKEIARLVASISHEIISPVSNIAGFSRLLASDPPSSGDDKGRDLLLRIRRNAVRLAHLVEEASTLARLVWGLETPLREPMDLRVIIGEAVKETAEVTGAGEGGPVVALPEGDLAAIGDGKRLRIAVGGLFLNLAKDLNARRMTLSLERAPAGWRITAWHASPEGDDGPFTPVEGEGGGPSAVIVMELFRALGCAGTVFVSPEGARKLQVDLPQ